MMSTLTSLLDAPEHLLAAHDRLRSSAFPVVTVVNAHEPLDARVWLCRWARARGRLGIVAPEPMPEAALAAYRVRTQCGGSSAGGQQPAGAGPPVLLIPGDFQPALALSVSLTAIHPELPVAVASGIATVVENLLDPGTPKELVIAALQG